MYIPNFVDRKAEKRKTYPKFRIVNMNWRMIYACDMIHLWYDTSKGHSYTYGSTTHLPKHKMEFLKWKKKFSTKLKIWRFRKRHPLSPGLSASVLPWTQRGPLSSLRFLSSIMLCIYLNNLLATPLVHFMKNPPYLFFRGSAVGRNHRGHYSQWCAALWLELLHLPGIPHDATMLRDGHVDQYEVSNQSLQTGKWW